MGVGAACTRTSETGPESLTATGKLPECQGRAPSREAGAQVGQESGALCGVPEVGGPEPSGVQARGSLLVTGYECIVACVTDKAPRTIKGL